MINWGEFVGLLVSSLLMPLIMIGFGAYYTFSDSIGSSRFSGYRSPMSMLNADTWHFAHKLIGRLWFFCGIPMLPITLIAMLLLFSRMNAELLTIIVVFSQLAVSLGTVIATEIAMHRTFDRFGNRK